MSRMAAVAIDPRELKNVPPFSWFNEEQIEWALPTIQERLYGARATVTRTGCAANGIHVVLSGRVHVIYESRAGRRFIAASICAQDFFGEMDLFEQADDPVSVITAEASKILYIPHAVVLECLKDNAEAAMCMLRKVMSRARLCQRTLAQFAFSDVYARVAGTLLDHTPHAKGLLRVEVGAEQIAGLVGSSREMVSRVLKEMIAQGFLRRDGRTIYVTDREALQLRSAVLL
jgi:CRP/FNR family transcriptional regulator, cyclic AMP receptor protein